MKFKGTTVLFILFVGLGVYVYFNEYRGSEERQKAEEAGKKAIPVEQKDIKEISLIYPDRQITAVKKAEKQWQMTTPTGVEADSDAWDQLASSIPNIERKDTIAANAQDLASFGLKEPAVKVVAKLADGKTTEISFGSENPKKTENYAKLGNSNDVFLTPSNWSTTFNKTISDLRNKKVLEFEADDIDAVKIAEGNKEIELQKSGQDWQLKKPIDAKADATEASTLISSIQFARASAFAEPNIDAKTASLDPPAIRITLHDAKAKTDRVLLIGKPAETDKYYARDASRASIFIIDKEIAEKVRRPIFDWRDKSITRLDRDKVDEIEIQRGPDKFLLKKSGSDWKLSDNRKLQWDKISGMMNTLEFDKAKDVVETPKALSSYGLDKPILDVIFRQGSNQISRITFGLPSPTPEGIYVKTSDSNAVKVVSKDVFDKFNVKPDDLLETAATTKPPA